MQVLLQGGAGRYVTVQSRREQLSASGRVVVGGRADSQTHRQQQDRQVVAVELYLAATGRVLSSSSRPHHPPTHQQALIHWSWLTSPAWLPVTGCASQGSFQGWHPKDCEISEMIIMTNWLDTQLRFPGPEVCDSQLLETFEAGRFLWYGGNATWEFHNVGAVAGDASCASDAGKDWGRRCKKVGHKEVLPDDPGVGGGGSQPEKMHRQARPGRSRPNELARQAAWRICNPPWKTSLLWGRETHSPLPPW